MTFQLKDKACVAGVANSAYGSFPETDAYGLGIGVLQAALDDAGLTVDDIDGIGVHRIPSYERFSEMMGLNNIGFGFQLPAAGRMSAVSLMMAAMAVASGEAKCVALVYGNNGRSVRDLYGGGDSLWAPWGFTSPGARHAMMWRRHMDTYGSTSVQLAHIARTFRDHASLNPDAVMRTPFTIEEHQASRWICEPLHLLDYCLINDGAVAMIVTSPERAKDLKKPPVYVSGFARKDTYQDASYVSPPDDMWHGALSDIAGRVYDNAGIGRDAVDGLMIYDNFTPTVAFSLEGMGFCARGEGGAMAMDGQLKLGARWPTNTNGGHLSESYMQGWGLLAEAVRQCRRECGDRQIADCEVVQYIAATPVAASILLRR